MPPGRTGFEAGPIRPLRYAASRMVLAPQRVENYPELARALRQRWPACGSKWLLPSLSTSGVLACGRWHSGDSARHNEPGPQSGCDVLAQGYPFAAGLCTGRPVRRGLFGQSTNSRGCPSIPRLRPDKNRSIIGVADLPLPQGLVPAQAPLLVYCLNGIVLSLFEGLDLPSLLRSLI